MSEPWSASSFRIGVFYRVWRLKSWDSLGSRYEHYVENGKPRRFFFEKNAEAFAKQLNEKQHSAEERE